MRQLCKGNVAVIKGAVLAGCRAYYGYPITPASEVAEAAALYFPEVGGTFVQAESETASINMVYGSASAGERVMTASSGPGLSLMQEGISYLAGAELPCVIVDVMRGGPGLGNIAPEQSDYFAMVKGGGHGNYRNLVVAPASVQEMADLTILAFELADRYRNPAIVLTDGFVGQMMEPLDLEYREIVAPEKPWAVKGTAETRKNMISSIFLESDDFGRAPAPHGSEVHAGAAGGNALRRVPHRRRGTDCCRLRHRVARAALGGRRSAQAGNESRIVPAHHVVAIPIEATASRGAARGKTSRRGTEQRPDGGRCPPGAEWQAARSSSTDAWAATCPRSKSC